MKNLGKISLLFILLTSSLFGSVSASIEPKSVSLGDTVTYALTMSGNDIKKPIINDICGNDITGTSSQTSLHSVNGNYQKSYTLSYSFTPLKSCTIDSVDVQIDSKVESSNSVSVVVKPRVQDLNAEFTLMLTPSKKELFVGEPFTLTLLLKQKRDAKAVDSKFIAPEFSGFWIKSEGKAQRSEEDGYIITKVVYELASQREGTLSIKPAQLKIASRVGVNNWGTLIPQVKWTSYYSNELQVHSKPLPNGAKLVGDFSIDTELSRVEVNPNEAVNLTLNVKGDGNLEDIESFKPYIKDVNVFDEKIVIEGSVLSQKLVFVSEKDFTIPAFELVFYNTKTQKIEKITTEPIDVKVSGNLKREEVEITRDETPVVQEVKVQEKVVVKNDYLVLGVVFLGGVFLGVLIMFLTTLKKDKKSKKLDLKDEKVLLMKLLPFKDNDKEVQKIVDVLENNIYSKEKKSIDKKLLKEIVKKYDIS